MLVAASALTVPEVASSDENDKPAVTAAIHDHNSAFQRGAAALSAKDYVAAKLAFDVALAIDPRDSDTNFGAGHARAGLGDLKGAISFYVRAIRFNPYNMEAETALGQAYMQSSDIASARNLLAKLKRNVQKCGEVCAASTEMAAAISAIEVAIKPPPHSVTPIKEGEWVPPSRRLYALTRIPPECVDENARNSVAVLIGRVAFRDPQLLGPQASAFAMSCNACHRNGRGNPDFQVHGLSGQPGTADAIVWATGERRSRSAFRPIRIPDLARDPPKVSRDQNRPDLRNFISVHMGEAFNGHQPTQRVIDGLTAYVRAQHAAACPKRESGPLDFGWYLSGYEEALAGAEEALRNDDDASAIIMLDSAFAMLGAIAERFALPDLDKEQHSLLLQSKAIAQLQVWLSLQPTARAVLPSVQKLRSATGGVAELSLAVDRSLFNPDLLAKALR